MCIKKYIKSKTALFSFGILIVSSFLFEACCKGYYFLWFTIWPGFNSSSEFCFEEVHEKLFGWPLAFLNFFGINSCDNRILLNPLFLVFDFLLFFVIIKILEKIFKQLKSKS